MALNSVNRNITVGKLGDVYIFMPAAGSYNGLAHKGNEVMNLSKSLRTNDQKKKEFTLTGADSFVSSAGSSYRFYGMSVRPVINNK